MESESNDILDRENLLETLLSLVRENRSGLLSLLADEKTSVFQIQDGSITAATWDVEDPDFLKTHIIRSGMVPEKTMRKSMKRAHSRNLDLPTALSQEGGPLPARLREMMGPIIQEELWRLAEYEQTWWNFEETLPEEGLFDSELLALKLRLNIEFLVVDIAGRESNWDILDQVFPARHEVMVTRAASCRYFDAGPGKYEEEQAVLILIDGERDVDELIVDSSLDAFTTLKSLHRFKVLGEIRELNPAELIQVAVGFKSRGRFDKCLNLYLRAEALGGGTFDLDLTIGSIYETTGKDQEAFDRYLAYAEKCLNAGERGTGAEAYRRAMALRSSDPEIRENFIRILDPVEDRSEYLEETRTYLDLAKSTQDNERIRSALRALIIAADASPEEIQVYIDSLNQDLGPREAFQDLDSFSQNLLEEERYEEALPILNAAAELRSDNLDVLEALVQAYLVLDRKEEAAAILEAISELIRKMDLPREDRQERLLEIHTRILDLVPEHSGALRYLAWKAEKKGDIDVAADYLGRLRIIYRQSKNRARQAYVLKRLMKITADDPELKVEYAECQLESGPHFRGARSLLEAASMMAGAEETRHRAEVLYKRVLEHLPFNRVALKEIARLYENLGNRQAAREHLEQLAEICLVQDEAAEAADIFESLITDYPDESEYVRGAARACLDLLPAPDAVVRLRRALDALLKIEDYGLVRWLIARAGNQPDLREVLKAIPDHEKLASDQARDRVRFGLRRTRVKKILVAVRDRLRESAERVEERLREARIEWEAELKTLLEKKEMEVEARVRTEMPGEGLHHVHPSDNEGTEEESTGLSGGIKRMETTFNLPASIREITRKLKGMK